MRHGDPKGVPDFRMIGGTFQIEPVNAALLGLMSQTIHLRTAEFDTSRLGSIIELIMDGYAAERPGRDAILQRFLGSLARGSAAVAGSWPGALISGADRWTAGCAGFSRASRNPFRCAARMDGSRVGEACWYVKVGVCGPFCDHRRMRADGVPRKVANELGPGFPKPRRENTGSSGGGDRL